MGNIRKILDTLELPDPEGFDPTREHRNIPFQIELHEDIHLHWQDLRLEMLPEDFDNFARAIKDAHENWKEDGKPEELDETIVYGKWPNVEYEHLDRPDENVSTDGNDRHNFKLFPRTERGELHFDKNLQIEVQEEGHIHVHYGNFRWEMGPNTFLKVAKSFTNAYVEYKQNEAEFDAKKKIHNLTQSSFYQRLRQGFHITREFLARFYRKTSKLFSSK